MSLWAEPVKRALPTIAVLILCLVSSFADPTPTAAMATAIGEAFVNGNALTRSSAVLDGDRLTTGRSAALILHLAGSSIHIGPNAEALYHGTSLELLAGMSEVQGRESIVAGAFTLSPTGESRFTVQRESKQIALHLLRGRLRLSRGKEVTLITGPGEYTLEDNQALPSIQPRAITKTLPIAAGSAAGTSVVITHWLTAKDAATSTSCLSGKSPTSCK